MTQRERLALVRDIALIQRRARRIGCDLVAGSLDAAAYWAGRAVADGLISMRDTDVERTVEPATTEDKPK